MPLVEDARRLVRDPDFSRLPPEERVEVFRLFAIQREPNFGRLSEAEQLEVTRQIIGTHTPGFLEQIGAAMGAGVRMAPVAGPAIRAYEDPAQQRPLSRRLVEAFVTGAMIQSQAQTPFGAQAGAALMGRDLPDPEAAGRMVGEAVSSTAAGRASAEIARDIVELTGFFKAAGAAVRFGGRFLGSAGVTASRALVAPSVDEATILAARAAQQAGRARLFNRIGTDITAGELFGLADAVERQDLRPLEQFVVNPLAMAALGVGLMGAGAAIRRFGPVRVQEATALLNADTGLQTAARDAQRVVDAVRQHGGLDREDAADLVFRAARGAEADTESMLLRETLIRDPRLLKNEFGLHLVRMQRPHYEPQLQVTAEGPLRVTFEDPKTRRETSLLVKTKDEAHQLAQQAERGEIVILRASGRAQDIALFERPTPGRVEMPDGTEPLSPIQGRAGTPPQPVGREPETFEPTPTMFPGGRPGQVEPPTTMPGGRVPRQESILDVVEREQLTTELPLAEFEAQRGAAMRAMIPERSSILPGFNILAQERVPLPPEGSPVQIVGTGTQGTVLSTGDPRGLLVKMPSGDVVIAKTDQHGRVVAPDVVTGPVLARPETTAQTQARQQLREGIKAEPQTVKGPRGQVVQTQPDPQTGTVSVTDGGQTTVVRQDVAERLVQEKRLSPSTFETEPTEALIQRVEALMRKRQGALTGTEYRDALREQTLVLHELLRRSGRQDKPSLMSFVDINRFIRDIRGQRGSMILPEGRMTPLGTDDLIGAQARALGGRASQAQDGRITVTFKVAGRDVTTAYGSRAEADAGLRGLMAGQFEQARVTEAIVDAGERRVLSDPGRTVDPSEIVPAIRVVDAFELAPIDRPHRYMTGFNFTGLDDMLIPVITRLNRLGPAGREFAARLQTMREIADRLRGQAVMELEKALEGLTKEEIQVGLQRAIEHGAPARREVMEAYRRLRALADQHYAAGQSIGLPVAPRIENHFPHAFDIAQLRDQRATENLVQAVIRQGWASNAEGALLILERQGLGTSRDQIVRRLIEKAESRGRRLSRTEAEGVVDRFIFRNASRISGHLERERLGVKGYLTDARRAYSIYFSQNARRLAEARVFGPRDERITDLIDELRRTYGQPAADFARRVFDLQIGRERVTMPSGLRELYTWQTAKLSLSVLMNLAQPFNIAMRTNLASLGRAVMGIGRDVARLDPGAGARHAREVGAVVFDIFGDQRVMGAELDLAVANRSILGRIKKKIEDFSTAAFNLVEIYSNRSIGVRAGEEYFMQQVNRLRASPTNALARRRLQELRFKPDEVLRASQDDLTEMMYTAGQRISNETQFRADVLSMPLWGQSGLGRLVYQFKSFAFNQARFIATEIFGRHGDLPRRLRAIAAVTIAYPVIGIKLSQWKAGLMGETMTSEFIESQLDEETFQGYLLAGLAGVATAGAFGIVADMAATAATGNKFALTNFFLGPSASTMLNVLDIGAAVARGAVNADPEEFERAARTAGREFGGFGATVTHQLLGEAE